MMATNDEIRKQIAFERKLFEERKEREALTAKLNFYKQRNVVPKPKNPTIEKIKTGFGKVAKEFGSVQKDYLERKGGIFG